MSNDQLMQATPSFDYSVIAEESKRSIVKMCAETIRRSADNIAQQIIVIGEAFSRAKENLPHGAWIPFIETEIGWTRETVNKHIQLSNRFKCQVSLTFGGLGKEAMLELAAPSTPDSVVSTGIEKVESGEKFTVEEIKQLKAQANIAKQNLDVAKNKIKELEAREPEKIIEKIEVVPADYQQAKDAAEKAREESARLKRALEKAKSDMDQAIKDQVKARMDAVKKDVETADARVVNRQKELEKIEAQLAKMNRSLADVRWHEEMISKHFTELQELSFEIGDLDHCKEASPRWMKLAIAYANAAKIIKVTMCDGKEFDEKFYDQLSDA